MYNATMEILANWNGEQMPLKEVRVSVLDRAFLFGDSVYEVIRVYGGRLWNFQEHIKRLSASLKELGIEFDVDVVETRLQKLMAAAGLSEALVYVQVTRGAAPRHHYFPSQAEPNCLIYIEQFLDPFQSARQSGARAITYPDIRWGRNDIKATSMAANCLAANAAREKDCLEAILVKDDIITEGSHTSVFGVKAGRVIVSPSSQAVLPGITKNQVIQLCLSAGIEMLESRLHLRDLSDLEELSITATPEEIIGIVQVDERLIKDGKPGTVTLKLERIFQETVKSWLQTAVQA